MNKHQNAFDEILEQHGLGVLHAEDVTTLQVNVGKLCNQACKHCHVEAGPKRTELMTRETMDSVLEVIQKNTIHTLDITGGAPEMNPHFDYLVEQAAALGVHIIVRHNFTVQFVAGRECLPEFFREHRIEVIASLPYFQAQETDAQRGKGVFDQSIDGMRRLNAVGYGVEGTGLVLNLIYNPTGAFLPPDQAALERDFKRELASRYGLVFNSLYTLTNMPVKRFEEYLKRTGNYERYMKKLIAGFNPDAVGGLMCRSLINVNWDGRLSDCDFNQMLDIPTVDAAPQHIANLTLEPLKRRKIATGYHCFGCTVGSGST